MASVSINASAVVVLLGCARFSPSVAMRPPAYRPETTFVLAAEAPVRLDPATWQRDRDQTSVFPELRVDPADVERTPALVGRCMATPPASLAFRFRSARDPAAPSGGFVLSFVVTSARPGSVASRPIAASVGSEAPMGSPQAAGGIMVPSGGWFAAASATLEIRSEMGTVIDIVPLRVQRQPEMGETVDDRARQLCAALFREASAYIAWRLSGNP